VTAQAIHAESRYSRRGRYPRNRPFEPPHLSMRARLYLRLSALGTSSRLALLPGGIVVEPSPYGAWLLITGGTTRYGFPAIHLVLTSTVWKKSPHVRPTFTTSYVRYLRLANAELLGERPVVSPAII
jgi:hypothetical protein